MNSAPLIHRAGYIVPVTEPVLKNGAVVTAQGHVVLHGPFTEMSQQYPEAEIIDHGPGVLLPGLINAHIHLELSHLQQLGRQHHTGSFTQWIMALVQLRDQLGAAGPRAQQAAQEALQQQYRDGVVALLDIGNTGLASALPSSAGMRLLACREYLGFSEESVSYNLAHLDRMSDQEYCSAHALYSTHLHCIQALKKRAHRLGHVFPIHVAESQAEAVMIREGAGEMVDFLRHRKVWEEGFLKQIEKVSTPLEFLAANGVLDPGTLCVHCVQVKEADINLLVRTGVGICLCPGSNRFLGVGMAPVEQFIAAGLLPALGTDSLASNSEISLWREMALLAEEHPCLSDAVIFSMATLGGARALGLERDYGAIAAGKRADLLYVELPVAVHTEEELLHFLVHGQREVQPRRVLVAGG